jgi:putative toxin-antitoxin system antitoxin component (TIGR02293 family)
MRQEPTTGEALIARVRSGYQADLVKHAAAYFAVPEKRLLHVIGVPVSTAHRYQAQGQPLEPAASERIHRLAIITREAIGILGEEDRARAWLLRPNLALGDVPPLDLLDTEIGANAVRRSLLAIAEGGVV